MVVLVVVAKLRKLFERIEDEKRNKKPEQAYSFGSGVRLSASGTREGGLDFLNIHSANSNQK